MRSLVIESSIRTAGTIAGLNTRRFHGWLIAALPAPHGRMMMMNQIAETLHIDDRTYQLTADNLSLATQTDTVSPFLKSFRLEVGLPVFTYASDEFVLEKRLCMVHAQNTTYITYHLLKGKAAHLELCPAIDIRPHEGSLAGPRHEDYRFSAVSGVMNSRWPAIYHPSVSHGGGKVLRFVSCSNRLLNSAIV